jgi:hypothetical protein
MRLAAEFGHADKVEQFYREFSEHNPLSEHALIQAIAANNFILLEDMQSANSIFTSNQYLFVY